MGDSIFDDVKIAVRNRAGLAQLVRAQAGRFLAKQPGLFILTGLGGLSEQEAREFAAEASTALGTMIPQDAEGTLIRSVRDRGLRLGEGKTGRYSDSRQGGNLHTDGPHRPDPVPDVFTLFCLSQAASGGDFILVQLPDLLRELATEPEVVEVLRRRFHFDRREAQPEGDRTVRRPVIDGDRVHYLREYIEIGHSQPGVPPLTEAQLHALNRWDRLLDDPRLHLTGRLQPGEMAFVSNRLTLHGRTEFTDDPDSPRHMLRTWIKTDDYR